MKEKKLNVIQFMGFKSVNILAYHKLHLCFKVMVQRLFTSTTIHG